MSWDYADMSKQISEAGGPQAFVDQKEEKGRQKGRDEMKPVDLNENQMYIIRIYNSDLIFLKQYEKKCR